MYLVAQRVRSVHGMTGINSTRYEHTEGEVDWARPDVFEFVTTQTPGRRVAQELVVPPGGNAVLSYLDILSPSPLHQDRIDEIINRVVAECRVRERARLVGPSWWTEYLVPASSPDREGEVQALRAPLLRVATSIDEVHAPPLSIVVRSDGEGWTFELDETSILRVPRDPGGQARAHRVRVPFDVADDFRAIHGALYPHVAEWLTGLQREELADLGGIEFVHLGQRVWNLPARREETS